MSGQTKTVQILTICFSMALVSGQTETSQILPFLDVARVPRRTGAGHKKRIKRFSIRVRTSKAAHSLQGGYPKPIFSYLNLSLLGDNDVFAQNA